MEILARSHLCQEDEHVSGVFMMMKELSTDYELHFASPVFILLQVLLHCHLRFVMEFENRHLPVYVGKLCVDLCCYSVAHGLHRFGLCMIDLMLGPVDGQLDFESSLLNQ